MKSTIHNALLATTVGVVSFAGLAQAQQVAQADVETERTIQRQQQQQERLSAIGGGADGFGPLLREVTFQEILADPDNIELNILYARTQIKHGRMDKAQATLERILLIQPDFTMVKMLYGLVLFRLDNMSEAEAVFNGLLQGDLSANDRTVVQSYLKQIAQSKKRLNIKLTISAGVHYDDNRTAAPRSGNLSVLDSLFELGIDEKPDWGSLLNVGGEARYDLGFQRPHEAYGKVALVADEQRDENAYDLIMGRADVGVTLATDMGRVDVSANHSIINLGRAAYLETPGTKVRWDASPNAAYVPYAEVSASHQLYRSHNDTNANAARNGWLVNVTAGAHTNTWIANGTTDISVSRTVKQARASYNAYRAWGVALSHTQVFDQGRFLIGNAGANVGLYRMADLFVSAQRRRDVSFNMGLTAGTPLGATSAGSYLPDGAKDILWTTTIERTIANSNIVNYTYNNWRGQMMLTKSFAF